MPSDQPPSDDVKVAGAPIEPLAYHDTPDATAALPGAGSAESAGHGLDDTRHDLGTVPPGPAPYGGVETATIGAGDAFSDMRRKPRKSRSLPRIGVIAAAAVVVLVGGTAGAMVLTGGSSPAKKKAPASSRQAQADAAAPAPFTEAQRKQIESQRRTELKKKALRAARDEHVRPMLFAKGEPPPTPKASDPLGGGSAGNPVPAGEAQKIAKALLPGFGWSPSTHFGCLVNMWNRESGWRVHAANPSGAYGIPQALPGSKMASAGSDWQNNATTQIKWGLGYIKDRYGSPCAAWSYWQQHGSY